VSPALLLANGIGLVLTLGATIATVVTTRAPRRLSAGSALLSALLAAGLLPLFLLLGGVRLNIAIAVPALVVGGIVGLIRGTATRLTAHEGQVWAQVGGCYALLWGASLLVAQVALVLGSPLWAALGLIPLCLATGSEVAYHATLLVRRLRHA
jgi:hypothetical protein